MKVLFITIGAVANLADRGVYTDLLRKFKSEGHQVYVVGALEKRTGMSTYLSTEYGIKILRVRTGNITKSKLLEKGIATIRLGRQYQKAIMKHYKNIEFDLILYTTPPITIANLITKVKRKCNAFTYLLLKDIFPQNSVDLNMLSTRGYKGIIYWYFRYIEKKLYKVSDKIGCMSKANIEFLHEYNPDIPLWKIEECPNTIDPMNEKPVINREEILMKYNIPTNKYILMYGGNFGRPQNVEYIVKVLKRCNDINNIHFIMCGAGTDFYKLENYYKQYSPNHITIISQLPYKEYVNLLSACDVGLLFLDYRFTIPNFPSRLLDYMNYRLPVIAATDKNTDVGKVIEDNGFGWWIESKEPEEFYEFLKKTFSGDDIKERLQKMSKMSKKCLEEKYTTEHSYEKIMDSFRDRECI